MMSSPRHVYESPLYNRYNGSDYSGLRACSHLDFNHAGTARLIVTTTKPHSSPHLTSAPQVLTSTHLAVVTQPHKQLAAASYETIFVAQLYATPTVVSRQGLGDIGLHNNSKRLTDSRGTKPILHLSVMSYIGLCTDSAVRLSC